MNEAAHSGFETQRRRHQKSKTGVSVALHERTYTCHDSKDKLCQHVYVYSHSQCSLHSSCKHGVPGTMESNPGGLTLYRNRLLSMVPGTPCAYTNTSRKIDFYPGRSSRIRSHYASSVDKCE